MGACTSKQNQFKKQATVFKHDKINESKHSSIQEEVMNPMQERQEVEEQEQIHKPPIEEVQAQNNIQNYEFEEELKRDEIALCVEKGDDIKQIVKLDHLKSEQLMVATCNFINCINEMEESILLLDRPYPGQILHNFQNMVASLAKELGNENLTILKNKSIPLDCLILSVKTYHLLNIMRYKMKAQVDYTKEQFKDQEMIQTDELKAQYLKLSNTIKLEMIQTYQKGAKMGNNPMLMKFNTKHALTLAKQQTLKQSQQEQESEADLDNKSVVDSFYQALSWKNLNQVVKNYDSSSMRPSH